MTTPAPVTNTVSGNCWQTTAWFPSGITAGHLADSSGRHPIAQRSFRDRSISWRAGRDRYDRVHPVYHAAVLRLHTSGCGAAELRWIADIRRSPREIRSNATWCNEGGRGADTTGTKHSLEVSPQTSRRAVPDWRSVLCCLAAPVTPQLAGGGNLFEMAAGRMPLHSIRPWQDCGGTVAGPFQLIPSTHSHLRWMVRRNRNAAPRDFPLGSVAYLRPATHACKVRAQRLYPQRPEQPIGLKDASTETRAGVTEYSSGVSTDSDPVVPALLSHRSLDTAGLDAFDSRLAAISSGQEQEDVAFDSC